MLEEINNRKMTETQVTKGANWLEVKFVGVDYVMKNNVKIEKGRLLN